MKHYSAPVVAAAEKTVQQAIKDVLSIRKQGAVIGVAPAGAGKSYAVASAVIAARKNGLRVAVAAPTNEQVFALIANIATRAKKEQVTAVPASSVSLPDYCTRLRNVQVKRADDVTDLDGVIIGTLNKLGDAHAREDLESVDLLLMDEAYQANAVQYYAVGDLAPRHLLVGDSGQLAPFTTAPEGDRWRGLDEDPLLTAIEALLRNHPETVTHKLPITRRLDKRAMSVVPAFYPDHAFEPAVLAGVRRLTFGSAKGRTANRVEDRVLETARDNGWAYLELPDSATVVADPETISWIVRLIQRLFARRPRVQCENNVEAVSLRPSQVAIAVSHNDQKHLLRVALDNAGFDEVVVDTANKLQGLTFEVVFAWHPLAGLTDTDEFHLDPGRLCVMLTRHRHACIVIGRVADRRLVEGLPPATPAYVGWDANPMLDGWFVHEGVFAQLEQFRISSR